MKLSFSLFFTVVFLSIFYCDCIAQNQQNTSNQQIRKFIEPKREWTSTNLNYQVGQKITITASGILNWFTGGCNEKCISTPDGLRKDQKCPPTPKPIIAPHLKCYSLIGRIGKGEPFQVGSCYSGVATTSGLLELGVNDENFNDNTGGWEAIVGAELPSKDDLIIYWNGGLITHSGIVAQVDGCKVLGFDSFIQLLGSCIGASSNNRNPDDFYLQEHFGNWTTYHSDLPNPIPIGSISVNNSEREEGLTNKNHIICLSDDIACGKNCHGFTFRGKAFPGIKGYALLENGTLICHKSTVEDISTAVKIILRDNGYRQIFSQGHDGKQHFDEIYSVGYFQLP